MSPSPTRRSRCRCVGTTTAKSPCRSSSDMKWLVLSVLISAPLLAHTGPHIVVPQVVGIVVDGDFADWPKEVEWHAIESPDPKSITARFAVGVDRARGLLNVAVDVTDDVIV